MHFGNNFAIEEQKKQLQEQQRSWKTQQISLFSYQQDEKLIQIQIKEKKFKFELEDEVTKDIFNSDMKIMSIFFNLQEFKELFRIKQSFTLYKKINNIEYTYYTALEHFIERFSSLIQWRQKDPQKRKQLQPPDEESNKCCICQEELYENILNYSFDEIESQLRKNTEEEPIQLLQCDGHGFHLQCLREYVGNKQWIKCPICMRIYGVMEGDQPEGTMKVYFIKQDCEGYPRPRNNCDRIQSSMVNQVYIPGTSRRAYLPNTREGNEVLKLLDTSFKRKLTFTVGTSVTTGRQNQVVWNGIHHKTSMSGGSACYGYPDKTYMDRVKEELAAKGIK